MNKILIVDDSSTMRKIVMRALRQAGLSVEHVLEASNGVEALKAFTKEPDLDLVLSDLSMPQMDGIQLVRKMRRTHDASRLPIVMISTESSHSMLTNALESGANGYVTRPFTTDGIRNALGEYFE